MSKLYLHVLSEIFNQPMVATPGLMMDALALAQNRLGLRVAGSPLSIGFAPTIKMDDDEGDGESDYGDHDPDDPCLAIIRVYGPLVPRTGNLRLCSRMTAYESVIRQVNAAIDDTKVMRIALDVDSNGGNAVGCPEAAAVIRAANQIKPVHAIVNFSAFSGGYWLASAAGEVSVSQTSGVGSVGVIMKRFDISKAMDEAGVVVETLYRGDRKNDGASDTPISDAERDALNARMDMIYGDFVNAVAENRGMKPAEVIATQAGLFFGQQAIDAGLADRLESPQQAINRIYGLACDDARKARTAAPSAKMRAESVRQVQMQMQAEAAAAQVAASR